MKSTCLSVTTLALACTSFAGPNPEKVERPWLVRLRALSMRPLNHSDAFSALSINFPADSVDVSNKTFPEVDISYYLKRNIALELVLTYPQKHDVTLAGVGNIGTVTHLPPTLTAQYHFNQGKNNPLTPYVGAGLNLTLMSSNLGVGTTGLSVSKSSVGFAYGFGADNKLDDHWSLNFDYKHVDIKTDVKVESSGAVLTSLKVNPNLISFGVGYRF